MYVLKALLTALTCTTTCTAPSTRTFSQPLFSHPFCPTTRLESLPLTPSGIEHHRTNNHQYQQCRQHTPCPHTCASRFTPPGARRIHPHPKPSLRRPPPPPAASPRHIPADLPLLESPPWTATEAILATYPLPASSRTQAGSRSPGGGRFHGGVEPGHIDAPRGGESYDATKPI